MTKERIERFIVDRIKRYILTEANLEEVVRIANDELARSSSAEEERVSNLVAQLAEAEGRLAKLHDALGPESSAARSLRPG